MTERDHLVTLLRGVPGGLTRAELATRLDLPDRALRRLIEDAVSESDWPIVCERFGNTEGRYRIALASEWDVVNRANAEDTARAIALHRKARGRRNAFERRYAAGALFLNDVPDVTP